MLPYDKYRIKIDGSGRVTTRNIKFLRQFKSASGLISAASKPDLYLVNNTPARSRLCDETPLSQRTDPVVSQNISPGTQRVATTSGSQKIPRARKCLFPFNKSLKGLKEDPSSPITRF